MKYVLPLIFVSSLLSASAYSAYVPLQAAFFVLALVKSGIIGDTSKNAANESLPTLRTLSVGALYIFCGLALSSAVVVLISNTGIDIVNIAVFGATVMTEYLAFFAIIAIMRLKNVLCDLRTLAALCSALPTAALLSGKPPNTSIILSVILLLIDISLLFTDAILCRDSNKRNTN